MVAERVSPHARPTPSAVAPTSGAGLPGSHLPDELVDTLDKAFRRLRKSMVRPPAGSVPVPALGRQLDMAKVFACDAVAELSERSTAVAVKDVAAELDLEHSTVSRLLGEIEDDGLVTRGVDPADRRRTTRGAHPAGTGRGRRRHRDVAVLHPDPAGRVAARRRRTAHPPHDAAGRDRARAARGAARAGDGGVLPRPRGRTCRPAQQCRGYSPTRAASLRSTSSPASTCDSCRLSSRSSANASRTTRIASPPE